MKPNKLLSKEDLEQASLKICHTKDGLSRILYHNELLDHITAQAEIIEQQRRLLERTRDYIEVYLVVCKIKGAFTQNGLLDALNTALGKEKR